MIRATLILLSLWLAAPVLGQGEAPREIAERAAELIRESNGSQASDPDRSEELLAEAVDAYSMLSDSGSTANADLERTLGSASLILGDTGRSVLHLRRAQRLDPTDRATRETLAHARTQVRTGVAPTARSRVRSVVLWWRGHIPRPAMLAAALLSWIGAWSLAIVRRLGQWERGGISIGVLICASAVSASALVSEQWLDRASQEAVLIDDGVMALNGPAKDVYPPTFTEPMRAGVECRVLERREGWAHVRLRNTQDTWLPETAIEMVTPAGAGP